MRTLSLTFIGLSFVATLARAQAAAPAASVTTPPAAPKAAAPQTAAPQTAVPQAAAEKIESAAEPQGFTYSAEGRRDPFVSLLRRGVSAGNNSGPRAAGIAGLGAAEVSLRGTVVSQGAFVGILQGVDSKNYIVRVGDKLADGTIRSITADSMVILQQVNDPLSLEKQREVRKLLRQTEEAK
jgi:Tfp pilus assembly protein PilP